MTVRLSVYIFLWAINAVAVGDADTVIVTFPTFLLCLFNVSRVKSSYLTVADMFWFVYFAFFVLGPVQTLSDNYFRKGGPVFGVYFTDDEIFTAAAIPFLFALFATIAGIVVRKNPASQRQPVRNYTIDSSMLILLAAAIFVSFAAYVVFAGGFGNVLAARSQRDRESVSILRLVALASLLVSTFFSITIMLRGRQNGRSPGLFGIAVVAGSLALLAVAQNPYNTPRYFLIQSWLPVILLFLRGRLKALPFYVACLFGMLVVLPILSVTSRLGTGIFQAIQNIDPAEDFFRLPYVDVFDILVYEIRYVTDIGYSYGNRMLGAIFFFVPRAIWPGKSELIALQMGEELKLMDVAGTENLSLFFGGEFYADFGLVGVAVFGFLFSWAYLRFLHNRNVTVNGLAVREFIIIAAIPIVVRGPIGANAPLIFLTLIFFSLYLHFFARPALATRRMETPSVSSRT
ncbi:hypothetical protein [Affinirhizobium pseudoryzae]|uniref:hypothetical protein n=1 Tax=Allorhizobium pseudoryzae TaxID=379684 RepID=UPI0013EB357D|nr:hypothetical protein [Allorhizobium pseudoryzae]